MAEFQFMTGGEAFISYKTRVVRSIGSSVLRMCLCLILCKSAIKETCKWMCWNVWEWFLV